MAFFGRDSGIVVDNKIASTTDGGKTWNENNWDTAIIRGYSLAFTDINHIWLNDARYNGFIYRSQDAGIHWEADSLRDSLAYTIDCIYFLDSLVGIAGGGGMTMFRTSDGGKNWQRVHDPETHVDVYPMRYIAFSSEKVGIATTYDVGTWVLRTTDGGVSWKFTTDIYSGVANHSYALTYPDPNHAFFCTRTNLYHSIDSGQTWKTVGNSMPTGSYFRSIAFNDSLHGIAALAGSPLTVGYTSDGGFSWRMFLFDSSDVRNEYFLSFPDPSVAYLGAYDAIYKLNTQELSVSASQINIFSPRLEFDGDRFIVLNPGGFPSEIRVVDLLGQVIEEHTITANSSHQFSMQRFPREIFVEVHSQNQFKVFKVLQKR